MVAMPCGHIISISTDIDVSGMDSKMIRSNNGRTGSFCYLCRTSRAEAHDLAIVERGFFCDMSAEDLIEKIEDWMGEVPREEWENYEFVSARGDEKVRFGVKLLLTQFTVMQYFTPAYCGSLAGLNSF